MIAVGEQLAIRQHMQETMREGKERAAKAKRCNYGLVSHGTEREDCAEPREAVDFGDQKAAASRDFVRFGLVFRRHAADRVRDAHATQHQIVVDAGIVDAFGEAEFP